MKREGVRVVAEGEEEGRDSPPPPPSLYPHSTPLCPPLHSTLPPTPLHSAPSFTFPCVLVLRHRVCES
jgi:hypothetical protein